MHPQIAIDHRHRIAAHLAGADGVENRRGDVARLVEQVFVALHGGAGQDFLGRIGVQRLGRHDVTRLFHRRDRHAFVILGRKIVQPDIGLHRAVAAGEMATADAFRPQVTDRDGDRRERVQRIPQLVGRQGLHVILQIRRLKRGVGLGEHAELAGRHRQGTTAAQEVFQPHPALAPDRMGHRVERFGVLHLIDSADLQMVLKVLPNAGQIVQRVDPHAAQKVTLPDPRQLKDLGRIDRPRRKQHFALGLGAHRAALMGETHAGHTLAVQDQPIGMRMGDHPQVGALHRRAQETARRVPTHAALLVHLEKARTFVVAIVEIGPRLDPELPRAVLHGLQNVPPQALLADLPLAPRAVHLAAARMVILGFQEIGQHVIPAPPGIAQLPPMVIVRRLPAHVNHAVHRRAAAQHLAPRIGQRAPVQPRLGRGFHHPIRARIADTVKIPHRHLYPVIVVIPPGFEQQNPIGRIGAETVGQDTARGARTDNDIVIAAL